MAPRPLHAHRRLIEPDYFAVAEIDPEKVVDIVAHLRAGGSVPPVTVALYNGRAMPFDGHHRLEAHRILGIRVDAWTVSGKAFDRLCTRHNRAEDLVLCGGVPAMRVAAAWSGACG